MHVSIVTLALLLSTIGQTTTTDPTIINLNNTNVFFEKNLDVNFYTDNSVLLTSLNLQNFSIQISTLEDCSNKLHEMCLTSLKYTTTLDCNITIVKINDEIRNIRNKEFSIHHLYRRSRRGLINIAGSVSKFLFGTMDDEDSQNIYNKLNNLHRNNEATMEVVKHQTAVISSNFNALAKPVSAIISENENIRTKLDILTNEYDELNQNIATEKELTKLSEKFTGIITIMLASCVTIAQNQDQTIAIIDNLHDHRLHPLTLTYKDIFKTLDTLNGMNYNRDILNYRTISQLATINYLEAENKILIKIEIPIPQRETFTTFKTYLIPSKHENNFAILSSRNEYVATNPDRSKFILLTEAQLSKCKHLKTIETNTLVCSLESPTYSSSNQICLLNLFNNPFGEIPNCNFNKVTPYNQLTKLIRPNSWLFVACSELKLTSRCDGISTPINLHGTGIISFDKNCRVETQSFTLPIHSIKINKQKLADHELIQPLNMTRLLQLNTNKKTHNTIKISTHETHNVDIHEELNAITDLERDTAKLNDQYQNVSNKQSAHQLYILVTAISIIIIIIAIIVWIKTKARTRKSEETNTEENIVTKHGSIENIDSETAGQSRSKTDIKTRFNII